ncbi:nicotinamide N-methyltransferase-like [Spea bombifrons]|uniref:nicotinamide N-methyltransferase-like n=1 Tax=Spea bombifrons TaxID=233779 RepID=UPI002349771F|nr:nicotinamide N-methyltransferase-like [Spea bombifrons]
MDSTPLKHYHLHPCDPKHFFDTYFSPKTDELLLEEAVINPMSYLHKELVSGHIKGEMLVDISIGPAMYQLITVCEFFKEITLLELNDLCISEMEKWINNHEEAFDWSHASTYMMDPEGRSVGWKEKEELLRGKIKRILKCDFSKDNPTDPIVLPKADCLICMWILDVISIDKDAYISNLRKISSLLKPGGRLVLVTDINVKHFMIGEHKYNILTFDEEFLKSAIKNEGYIIETYETQTRKASYDVIDHEKVAFITALKQK